MTFRIRLSFVVMGGLAWSYLATPVAWPFQSLPPLQAILLAAAIAALGYAYRSVDIDVSFERQDAYVLGGYAVLLFLLHTSMLRESLSCDDFYHADRAVLYLHWIHFFLAKMRASNVLASTPVTAFNATLCFAFWVFAILLWQVAVRVRSRVADPKARYVLLFLPCVMLGSAVASFRYPVEGHPPLRLLPLFLGQSLFGLDDVSFRLPGVIAMVLVCFGVYRWIRQARPDAGSLFAFVAGLSVACIPPVLHATTLLQPSIWAFVAGCAAFLLLASAVQTRSDALVIVASVTIGLGCLLRQNAAVLWPAFWAIVYLNRSWIRRWALISLPVLFILPYAMTLLVTGHPALRPSAAESVQAGGALSMALHFLGDSLSSGSGLAALRQSTSTPWLLLLLAGVFVVLRRYRGSLLAFYLTLPAGYLLFFSVTPELSMAGRYQAEYVAPCLVATLLLLSQVLRGQETKIVVMLLGIAGFHSMFLNRTIAQDVYGQDRRSRRLSIEWPAPYKQALALVQRQRTGGRFVILDSVMLYNRMPTWLRGFTFDESDVYLALQEEVTRLAPATVPQLFAFLRSERVDYFLVHHGDHRESVQRPPALRSLLRGLSELPVIGGGGTEYRLLHRVVAGSEGTIDIWGRKPLLYGDPQESNPLLQR